MKPKHIEESVWSVLEAKDKASIVLEARRLEVEERKLDLEERNMWYSKLTSWLLVGLSMLTALAFLIFLTNIGSGVNAVGSALNSFGSNVTAYGQNIVAACSQGGWLGAVKKVFSGRK